MKNVHKGRQIEWIVLVLFTAGLIVISIFHEPWYDEAQAWEIAKGASLKEMFFVIPHYEGHPPLWHLILAIPARLGIPFEIGLKSIGIIISVASATLLLFLSKLPRAVRLILPFSYFFFYQYGVIVRPYGLMLLIMLILGMNYSKRKEHPWRILILLTILCLCGAYGMVFAGGLALCIVIELIREKGFVKAVNSFFRDPRSFSLLFLLIVAVVLVLEIIPQTDTFYAATNETNSFLLCLLYTLLALPSECFITSSSWFSVDRSLLQVANLVTTELILICILGLIVWACFICSASKKNLKVLLIPYIIFALFSAKVYLTAHHLGVIFIYFLFWAEFISRENDKFEIGQLFMKKIVSKEKDSKLLKLAYIIFIAACMIVPLVWSAVASINDIQYEYYCGRKVAAFLEDHQLEDRLILGAWTEDGSMVPSSEQDKAYVNTVMIGTAVPINAYFPRNIFFNLNHYNPEQGFVFHRRPTLDESNKDLDEWRSFGKPDVIVGKPKLDLVYGNKVSYSDYKLVQVIRTRFIWKMDSTKGNVPIFVRNDLLDKYHLTALEGAEYSAFNGISLTDEMKERYYNGESMEDILKPYFDAMFGIEE